MTAKTDHLLDAELARAFGPTKSGPEVRADEAPIGAVDAGARAEPNRPETSGSVFSGSGLTQGERGTQQAGGRHRAAAGHGQVRDGGEPNRPGVSAAALASGRQVQDGAEPNRPEVDGAVATGHAQVQGVGESNRPEVTRAVQAGGAQVQGSGEPNRPVVSGSVATGRSQAQERGEPSRPVASAEAVVGATSAGADMPASAPGRSQDDRQDDQPLPSGARPRRKGPGVPGYLKGKGDGRTWSPEDTLAAIRADAQDAIVQLQELVEEIEQVELAFVLVRQALERTQPPMFNRVALRWWISQTGQPRDPTLIQVRGTPQGKERPTALSSPNVKLRKDGAYALCHDLNREVVRIYWQLHTLRAEYRASLSAARKEMKGRKGRAAAITKAARRLLEIRAEATQRLITVGYEFKPIAPDLPEDGLPPNFWANLASQSA